MSNFYLSRDLRCVKILNTSPQAPITKRTFKITAHHSGKVPDVARVSLENSASVHQWNYYGESNQQCKPELISGNEPANVTIDLWSSVRGTTELELPANTPAIRTSTLTSPQSPANVADGYGVRIRGNKIPATSAGYTFCISGDNTGYKRCCYHGLVRRDILKMKSEKPLL